MARLVDGLNEWVSLGLFALHLILRLFIRCVINLDRQLMVSMQYIVCLVVLEDLTHSLEMQKVWLYIKDILIKDFSPTDTRYQPDVFVTEFAGHLHRRESTALDDEVLSKLIIVINKVKTESDLFGLLSTSQVITPRDVILGIGAALHYLETP